VASVQYHGVYFSLCYTVELSREPG